MSLSALSTLDNQHWHRTYIGEIQHPDDDENWTICACVYMSSLSSRCALLKCTQIFHAYVMNANGPRPSILLSIVMRKWILNAIDCNIYTMKVSSLPVAPAILCAFHTFSIINTIFLSLYLSPTILCITHSLIQSGTGKYAPLMFWRVCVCLVYRRNRLPGTKCRTCEKWVQRFSRD